MQKQDTMIQNSKCNSSRENTNAEYGKINKDASEINNNVSREFHDKDNITELQVCKTGCACTEKILNDAEESQVKMKEKKFPFNYENINSLYDMFVSQMELSPEQGHFSDPSTSNVSSESSSKESDVPPKEMPNESKLLKLFVNLDNEIKKLATFNIDLKMDKHRTGLYEDRKGITEEVQELLDIFKSMKRKVDRTSKENENFQNKIDKLLEANISNDVKNLVMQSYVEIKNKEEIERFSKESKDGDKFCNDVVEVKEKLSNRIVQLEKDFAKLEAQSIAFEIKENLRSTLSEFAVDHILSKDDSSPSSIVESHIYELEKESGENICKNAKREKKNLFETETCVFPIKIVELEKTLAKQANETSDLLMKIDNHEKAFSNEVKRLTTRKLTENDKENCDFGSKFTHLEKIIAQKTKDFDDVKLKLSNRTTKFEAYFENLEKYERKPPADKLLIKSQISRSWFTPKVVMQKDLSKRVTAQSLPKNEKGQLLKRIASLESKLASQDLRLCQKEYHELRTSYNALEVKFDSLNRTKKPIQNLQNLK
uniref:Uncharacterized protein n=1 Tax=Tanacetum cinerariifolium TaxID=118510 RepID=A0A6L2MGG2_TANCI|nr:hypothetical protein [Tanacetum cinerariifolium]